MELQAFEERFINDDFEQVLVLHPTDDGNQGGYFEARNRGRKMCGQEIWIGKLGVESWVEFEEKVALALSEPIVREESRGNFYVPRREVRLAAQRFTVVQPSLIISNGLFSEFGPSIRNSRDRYTRS